MNQAIIDSKKAVVSEIAQKMKELSQLLLLSTVDLALPK